MANPAPAQQDIARTFALLGGQDTIQTPVRNSMEAHDLLSVGLPSSALLHLAGEVSFLNSGGALDKAIGIGPHHRFEQDPCR